MNLFKRIREAAQKAAEAIQQRAKSVIDRARERFKREEEKEKTEEAVPEEPEEVEEQKSLSEKLKEEDLTKREEAQKKAYDSFNDEWYGGDLSREAYDMMWNTIGEFTNEYGEAYGSPEIILLYEEMERKFGADSIDKDFFRDFFETAAKSIDVVYPEDVFDKLYQMIEEFESKEEFYDSLQSPFEE